MANDSIKYPPELLEYIVNRIPDEHLEVFREIVRSVQEGSSGMTWTELVKKLKKRYMVEKALLLFETTGFINAKESISNKNEKRYIPDNVRGKQLAYYLSKNRLNKED